VSQRAFDNLDALSMFDDDDGKNDATPEPRSASRDLSDNFYSGTFGFVKHTEKVDLRLPPELRNAVELERQRMSERVGREVKTSAVIRAILEKRLLQKRRAA
jgi:hypothetical protein